MNIEKIPVIWIKPALYNPRQDLKPGEAAYEALLRSMTEFGCVQPLVWNKTTGNLVGGHQRLKILLAQGVTEVDVVVVELTPEKEKALNLALNKIQGDWDQQKLAQILDELISLPDFDLQITGFDVPEAQEIIDEVLRPLDEDRKEDFDPNQVPDTTKPAVTGPIREVLRGRRGRGDFAQRRLVLLACLSPPRDGGGGLAEARGICSPADHLGEGSARTDLFLVHLAA